MMAATQANASSDDQRSGERLPFGRPGTVRYDDDGCADAMIVDLNRDGCRIVTTAALSPGARVTIGIAPLGPLNAQVMWHGPTGHGCAFDVPLPPGAVTAAFGGSTLAVLPIPRARRREAALPGKVSPRLRLATIAGLTAASWCSVAAIGWAMLRWVV